MGWPVTFFVQSYFLGTRVFPHWLILDAAITLLVPKLVADVTRDGLFMLFHRARTWGTPWEDSEPKFQLRKPQFSLKTLLVMLTLIALLLGLFTIFVRTLPQ